MVHGHNSFPSGVSIVKANLKQGSTLELLKSKACNTERCCGLWRWGGGINHPNTHGQYSRFPSGDHPRGSRRDVAPSGAQGAVSGTFEFPSAGSHPCSLLPPLVPEYVRIPNVFTSAPNTRLNTRIHLPTPAYCPCRARRRNASRKTKTDRGRVQQGISCRLDMLSVALLGLAVYH